MDNSLINLVNLPWNKIALISVNDFEGVSTETLEYASNEANHDQMFESALESLRKEDPNATFEKAEQLVEVMRTMAMKVLATRKQ